MTARGRTVAMALLAVAVLAAACGGDDPGAPGGTIEVVLFGGPAEIAGYNRLVASFQSANPDVEVSLSPVARQDDLLARLTTSFAGGEPPDVFLINYLKYGQFAAQGVLEPVQPLLDGSAVISVDEFAEPPLEAFRFDGENLTCMPQNISSLEVYLNADLLAAAGAAAPQPGWTWDAFLATAEAVTDPASGTYGVGVEASLQRLAPFVWSAGGDMVDDPAAPATLTIAEGPAGEALDRFLDLQLVHGVAPPDVEEQGLDAASRFIDGRLGLYLDSRVSVPTLRESISDFTWDVAPLPVAPGGAPATILHGDAYCISTAADVEAAWRFVEHAMTSEGQTILAESGRTVPSRLDVAASPAFLEPEEPPASAHVFTDVIPTIRALPHTATWSQMQNEVDDLFADVFYGRVDREEGVQRMISTAESVFSLEDGR